MYLPAPDETIWTGTLRLVVQIPAARSLKDRRKVVWGFRDRVRARLGLAVAEVGHLERHDMAVLAVAGVSNDARLLRSQLDAARAEAASLAEGLLVDHDLEIIGFRAAPDR